MQIETIEELADILDASSLTRLEIEGEDWSLQLERPAPVLAAPPAPMPLAVDGGASITEAVASGPDVVPVDALMVGVFHEGMPPVTVGQDVRAGDILGAIEALALRNEIRSPIDARVVSVTVEDGQPVEYGQPLFSLSHLEEPAS
jgi:acetyl-CoA carboxylase biotin carboxyl carrier protein